MRREQGLRLQVEPRIDWFSVLVDLNRRGLATAAVAEHSGVPRSTLLGWKQGADFMQLALITEHYRLAKVPPIQSPRGTK